MMGALWWKLCWSFCLPLVLFDWARPVKLKLLLHTIDKFDLGLKKCVSKSRDRFTRCEGFFDVRARDAPLS